MVSDTRHMVIIGAGLAGIGAATTLRREGFTGRITVVSSDDEQPYDHVPLSKNYLRDEPGYHKLFLHTPEFYRDKNIDVRLQTTARAIDTAGHTVDLGRGGGLHYDKLLLATGSHNRRPDIPGSDLDGIFQLRTLAEADSLKAALHSATRLVVIGAGFVGCEIAASARQLGLDVTLVGRDSLPMHHALGRVGAEFYRDVHQSHGVHLRMGVTATAFRGTGGRVHSVVLGDGTVLAADAIVVGVGARPAVELAEAAGIPTGDGILTDETLATQVPDVFAAGDVANVLHRGLGRRLRVEHFATALRQGHVAARSMLGMPDRYDAVPFFFSDQYDVWMEYTGQDEPGSETLVRGAAADGRFIAFSLRGDRLTAAMNVNIRGVPDIVTPWIAHHTPLDRSALIDPQVDLAGLNAGPVTN